LTQVQSPIQTAVRLSLLTQVIGPAYERSITCVRTVNRTAVSIAEHGLDVVCSFVPGAVGARGTRSCTALRTQLWRKSLNLACMQGDVLADLSQADLGEAYLQAGISFQASKWSLDELRHQVSCDRSPCAVDTSEEIRVSVACTSRAPEFLTLCT